MDQQIPDEERAEMMIRFPYRTVAGVGLAGLLGAFSAPDVHADGGPDAGTFSFDGTPVTGGSNAGDALALSPGAAYTDQFTDSTLYYRIPRELEGSTLHVSVSTHSEDVQDDWEAFEVSLDTWEGDSCASTTNSGMEMDTRERLRISHISSGTELGLDPDDEDSCGEADELVLTIGPRWEDDDVAGRDFELLIHEEPAAENAEQMEEDPDYNLSWTEIGRNAAGALDADPGSSFSSATPLEGGNTYDLSISPGEVQVFSVPLDWGQYLQAETFFPEPGQELADQLDSMGSVSLAALNPMRGIVDGENWPVSSFGDTEIRTATQPVQWNNRYERSSGATLAGEYYLVVVADEHEDDESFPIDYLLTLETFDYDGAADGTPVYPAGYEDSRPAFGSEGDEGSADAQTEEQDRSEMTAVERVRSMGESTGIVISLGAFALLMMATGSLFMVRAIRRSQ